MKKQIFILFFFIALLLFSACSQKKPDAHPKHPNYTIIKPKVKYKPNKKNLGKMVKKLQGSPYVWAEEGPNNFDCSGFTYYMYGSMGIEIPRVARDQAKVGKRIAANDLQYGDLIFFATKNHSRKITHVGMYLGNGWFTHASTVKHEVIYSNLFTSPYYKKKLRICRRYLPEKSKTYAYASSTIWKTKPVSTPNKQDIIKNKKSTQHKAIVVKAPFKEIEQSSINGNFYIQVGSFIGNPNNHLLTQITQLGFHHKIIKFTQNHKEISKLFIGPYKNRSQATIALKEVQNTIQKDAFITEIR